MILKALLFIILVIAVKAINLFSLRIYSNKKKKESIRNEHACVASDGGKTEAKTNRIRMIYGGWVRLYLRKLAFFPSHIYRKWVLKNIFLMDIERNVVIYGGFEIRSPWNIHIGKGTIIGDESKLDGRKGIRIGENVNLSTGVWIWTEQHDINDPYFMCNCKGGEVKIGDRCWIGSRAIILPGLRLNEGCVVASAAVVTKDCEEFSVYGGVPAKKIAERNRDLHYDFDGAYIPFF